MSMISRKKQTIQARPGVRIFPIIHGSLECTVLLRRLFLTDPPGMVAVEMPENFTAAMQEAIPYADTIPVLTPRALPFFHLILEPLEPLVEATRSAYELKIPYHLIDAANESYLSLLQEYFPDTFALKHISVPELYQYYLQHKPTEDPVDESTQMIERIDHMREIHMADQIRHLSGYIQPGKGQDLLVVCGFKHVEGILRNLDLSTDQFEKEKNRTNEEYKLYQPAEGEQNNDEEPLEAILNKQERIQDYNAIDITTLSRKSPEVLTQPGYYNTSYSFARNNPKVLKYFDRIILQRSVYRETVDRYERESGELVPPQREKLFFQFTRNWSLIENRLIPDSYRLVIAARSFGSDNFARIFYDTINFLPPLGHTPFPQKRLTLDDLFKDSRLIRFRLKQKIKRKVPPPEIRKEIKREKYPGEWRKEWHGSGICSYPPEDIIIEDFGKYLQKKARSLLQGSETKTQPFTASLLDGIDYRETIRNFHIGKTYVKDVQIQSADAGSVVIIFDEDEIAHNWQVVWWGEHNQESDMAFYASPLGEEVVGPGICRCRYGGLMLTFPPGRLHDIWADSFYADFPRACDKLLIAALEYNTRRAVVHVSANPPAAKISNLAKRIGQKIVHIPISTVNPITMGRVRRFHVLDSSDRRGDAGDYVW